MTSTLAAGVGGTGGWHALAWAVDEASAAGAQVKVHRVCRAGSALADAAADPSPARIELADPALARAVAAARTQLGGHRVSLSLPTGDPGRELTRAGDGASLLVIGAPAAVRRHAGDIVIHVAEHAHCPVVVVRPAGRDATGPFAGRVVIGVDGHSGGQAAMRFGFGYAARHGLPVACVYVDAHETGPDWYDDSTGVLQEPADPAGRHLLRTQVEPWRQRFPAVPVLLAVLAGPAVDGLLRAGAGSRLLVIGNHRRGPAGRLATGNTTRAVLDRAPQPVAVTHDDDEGETW
ncbi:MAG TPA: universal stress protein [Actinoplanes sp.]|nr:universal stress protein [Actinoplanes sp.]